MFEEQARESGETVTDSRRLPLPGWLVGSPAGDPEQATMPGPTPSARHVSVCLHGVGSEPTVYSPEDMPYWITPDQLSRVLDLVQDMPEVELSLDDGFSSDVDIVLPALVERGLRASFFIPAGRIGLPGCVTASGLLDLVDAGMGVGSHGFDHVDWRRLSPQGALREFATARTAIEDIIQAEVTEAACPFGSYDARALRGLREHGYRRVLTSDRGRASRDAWLQPRITVAAATTMKTLSRALLNPPGLASRVDARLRTTLKSLR